MENKLILKKVALATLVFGVLVAGIVLVVGRSDITTTNPLIGWKGIGSIGGENFAKPGDRPPPLDKVILDDYQDFIKKLPTHKTAYGDRTESYYIMSISFFEDGTGQHAVSIFRPLDGTWLYYILLYDKNNKRMKMIKYSGGHYTC